MFPKSPEKGDIHVCSPDEAASSSRSARTSTLPVALRATASSSSSSSHIVGTLNALSTFLAADRSAPTVVGRSQTTAAPTRSTPASPHVGDEGGGDPVEGAQGRLDLPGVDLLTAAPADAAHDMRSADLDLTDPAGRHRCNRFGVDDADLHPVERSTAATPGGFRHIRIGAVAAVRPERLGHPEQSGPRSRPAPLIGWQQRLETARPQRRQVRPDRMSLPCQRFSLIGPSTEQRDAFGLQ